MGNHISTIWKSDTLQPDLKIEVVTGRTSVPILVFSSHILTIMNSPSASTTDDNDASVNEISDSDGPVSRALKL